MARQADEVADFLAQYPTPVQEVALDVRRVILAAIPEAQEQLDRSGRVIGYGFGPGYADLICTIIPSKAGVKLGIARSADLPDPQGLLEGTGKRHRYVPLATPADVKTPGLTRLLKAAVAAWKTEKRTPRTAPNRRDGR